VVIFGVVLDTQVANFELPASMAVIPPACQYVDFRYLLHNATDVKVIFDYSSNVT